MCAGAGESVLPHSTYQRMSYRDLVNDVYMRKRTAWARMAHATVREGKRKEAGYAVGLRHAEGIGVVGSGGAHAAVLERRGAYRMRQNGYLDTRKR